MDGKLDLALINGVITTPGAGTFRGGFTVRNGVVATIGSDVDTSQAESVVDARGMHVIPGVVDAHAHYGLGDSNDFATESRAAARAGITTVLSYLLRPEDDYEDFFNAARDDGETRSLIDFGFHFGVSSFEQAESLGSALRDFGVGSHKFFMSFKREGEGAYIGVNPGNEGILYRAMKAAAREPGIRIVVHSENIELVWTLAAEARDTGLDGLDIWDRSRPDFTESLAIDTVGALAAITGASTYIPHVSSGAGLRSAKRFGAKKPMLETCPHYLTHSCEEASLGSLGKVNPPLRPRHDVEALWAGIFDGTIDVVASDHNSRRRERKAGSIWDASAGFPSETTMLPALLTEGVVRRGLSLERAVELLCSSPAKIFGRFPKKGNLMPGADADFVILDLETARRPDVLGSGSFSDYSLDEGLDLHGWPVATFVRGRRVWDQEDGWADDVSGSYVPVVGSSSSSSRPGGSFE